MVTLGQYVEAREEKVSITSDDEELRPHLRTPWIREWVSRQHKTEAGPKRRRAREAEFDPEHFKYHVMVVGMPGQGKTRMAVRLATEQIALGASIAFLDAKSATIKEMLAEIDSARVIPPERVHLMLPEEGRFPSWNPILSTPDGIDAYTVASSFVTAVRVIFEDPTATRWTDVLHHFVMLAAVHGLTLFEAVQMMTDYPYLKGILRRPVPQSANAGPIELHSLMGYFEKEYSPTKTDVQPITTRLRPIVADPKLGGMLWSGKESFDLASLWKDQQALLISVDEGHVPAPTAKFVGGLLVTQLMKAALRVGDKPGARKVVLFLDEIAFTQEFLTADVGKIAGMGRGYGMHWVTCCQTLSQLDLKLREALTLAGTQMSFKADKPTDAALIAELAAAAPAPYRPASVHLSVASRSGGIVATEEYKYLLYGWGSGGVAPSTISLPQGEFDKLCRLPPEAQMEELAQYLYLAGLPCIPCIPHGTSLVKVEGLLKGLPRGSWHLVGPNLLGLVVRFPRPKTLRVPRDDKAEREAQWKHRLLNLPEQHFVLHSPMDDRHHEVKASWFPVKALRRAFLDAVLAKNETKEELHATFFRRMAEIDLIAQSAAPAPPPPTPEPERKKPKPVAAPKPEPEPEPKSLPEPGSDWGLDD